MADITKHNHDNLKATEKIVPAELTENDNLVEYIQPSSLELLKARYAAIEEDEQIRNEGFELAKKSGLIRKQRPENPVYGYYSSPVNPKDEIRTDVNSPLSQVFDSTRSEFDAVAVSFSDIGIEQEKKDSEVKENQNSDEAVAEKPKRKRTTKTAADTAVTDEEKPKRKRTAKAVADTDVTEEEKPKRKRTTKKKEEISQEETKAEVPENEEVQTPVPNNLNRYGFDTHTRVIFIDENADDGIKRNSEDELSSLFTSDDSQKKRRRMPWSPKRK